MQISVVDTGDPFVHLALSGRMDTASVQSQEARFYAHFAPRGANVLFDLSGVSFLASMGIRVLVSGAKAARSKGASVVIVAPPGPVRDTLELAALGTLVPVVDEVAVARSLLSNRAGGGR